MHKALCLNHIHPPILHLSTPYRNSLSLADPFRSSWAPSLPITTDGYSPLFLQADLCFACISENTSHLSFRLSLISLSIQCSSSIHVAAYGGISSFCWLRCLSRWNDTFFLSIQSQRASGPVRYLDSSTEWSQDMNGRHSAVKISGLNGHPGEVGISRGTLLLEDWEIPILLAIFIHHH